MNARSNPFPGLRPFNSSETHLFFGRDRVTDELLKRLRINRFLAVTGSSGCGKSSVVRAGVIPSLYGGYMTAAGSGWRVATMRPGAEPMANLAAALNEPGVLDPVDATDTTGKIFRETTLRRSRRGLVDAVLQANLPKGENVLVLVDQFEELFRFAQHRESAADREEALAFVNRLLAAANQNEVPIYIVITMRSDFIGDCIRFPGLPAELNEGQYLVSRMTRSELRQAIEGPVAIAGGALAPRLTVRLLNDVGDDMDQLPVLQHALMRTWDAWEHDRDGAKPIDLRHYEAIGTMAKALSRHAEEAFHAPDCESRPALVESIFRSLTDADSEGRGVRRPTSIEALCQIADASFEDVCAVIECFRDPDTSFLMPPEPLPLTPTTVIDISHESLMRGWDRLQRWVRDEKRSARTYRRIAEAAAHYQAETGGLWRPPELDLGLQWRNNNHPTKAWGLRYHPGFDTAMTFLDASRDAWQQETAASEQARRRKFQFVAGAAVALFGIAVYAYYQKYKAAESYKMARETVSETLTEVGRDSLKDVPQMEPVRARLLVRAQEFYEEFQKQAGNDPSLKLEAAVANRSLGDVYTLQGERVTAKDRYDQALEALTELVKWDPGNANYRFELAATYNRYGEFFRTRDLKKEAIEKYEQAIQLQLALVDEEPKNYDQKAEPNNYDYQHDLALTYNNLGIVLSDLNEVEAEIKYREAIAGFEALRKDRPGNGDDAFRLAQSHNNLGDLLGETIDAIDAYKTAIRIYKNACAAGTDCKESLASNDLCEVSDKELDISRERKVSLASSYNNLANLYNTAKDKVLAWKDGDCANRQAVQLMEELARPIPQTSERLAIAYNTRGVILEKLCKIDESREAFEKAIGWYDAAGKRPADQLLVNLGKSWRFFGGSGDPPSEAVEAFNKKYPDSVGKQLKSKCQENES